MIDSYRFEVKIPIPLNRLQKVESWLNTHSLLFKTHHTNRWVNSLYLDIPNLESYEQNLSGISQRKKVRIRWYNNLTDSHKAKLEFKYRRGGKGYKILFDTEINFESKRFNWMRELQHCYTNLPDEGKIIWGNAQSPVLICRYLREYYQSSCGKVRATFDKNIHVFDQRFNAQANLRKPVSLGDYVLLELKTDENNEEELSHLLSTCPLRPSRHSKYVNGVRSLTWA